MENRITDLPGYLAERDRIEAETDQRLKAINIEQASPRDLAAITAFTLEAEEQLLNKVMESVRSSQIEGKIRGNPYYKAYWRKQSRNLPKQV